MRLYVYTAAALICFESYTVIQLYSYTVIQLYRLYSYTVIQLYPLSEQQFKKGNENKQHYITRLILHIALLKLSGPVFLNFCNELSQLQQKRRLLLN